MRPLSLSFRHFLRGQAVVTNRAGSIRCIRGVAMAGRLGPTTTVPSALILNEKTITLQKRTMFIQTADTPNPESVKFMPGRPVLTSETSGDSADTTGFYVTRNDKADIALSPLAKSLFEIDGIKGVYLGPDFVTITKVAEMGWSHIRTLVFSAIMDHYASGKPALTSTPEITDTTILDDDDEIVAMIKELLESRIRPAVQEDGGDIRYVGFNVDTGIVNVQLAGSCVGCPSSSVTLKNGVENMLMHYIPEVTGVEAIEEESEEDSEPIEASEDEAKAKSYEERLRAAGIPFSD
jgi:Fe-S cluster biogenesis protein NfuA